MSTKLYYSNTLPINKNPLQPDYVERFNVELTINREIKGDNSLDIRFNHIDTLLFPVMNNGYFLLVEEGLEYLFKVTSVDDTTDDEITVKAVNIEYELNDDPIENEIIVADTVATNKYPIDIITLILLNSRIKIGIVAPSMTATRLPEPYTVGEGSIREAFSNFIDRYSLEYVVYYDISSVGKIARIDFASKLGVDKNVTYAVNNKIEGIKVNIDTTEQVTKVYPKGSNGLELNSVPLTVEDITFEGKYVRASDARLAEMGLDRHKTKVVSFSDVPNDPALVDVLMDRLKELAENYLIEHLYGVIQVDMTYRYDDISSFLRFKLGDSLKVKFKGVIYNVRVMQKSYNPFTNEITSVKLANVVPISPIAKISRISKVIDDRTGQIKPEKIQPGKLEAYEIATIPTDINDTEYIRMIGKKMFFENNGVLNPDGTITKQAQIKMELGYSEEGEFDTFETPYILMGTGTGDGTTKGKGLLSKLGNGLYLQYFDSFTGVPIGIAMKNDGIRLFNGSQQLGLSGALQDVSSVERIAGGYRYHHRDGTSIDLLLEVTAGKLSKFTFDGVPVPITG